MITIDLSDFGKLAKQLEVAERQIPFALSRAMNSSAFAVRREMIGAWPDFVHVHNSNFARASLRVVPSTKSNLTVEINDSGTGGRSLMEPLADGGIKAARNGSLAVPTRNVRQGPRGVVPSQRPRALTSAFRRGDEIWQRFGPKNPIYVLKRNHPARNGKPARKAGTIGSKAGSWGGGKRRVELKYVLKRYVVIPRQVPYRELFERAMKREMERRVPAALLDAISTAIRR